jgi:hypothetical protein
MFDLLRSRLRQGHQTTKFPGEKGQLPRGSEAARYTRDHRLATRSRADLVVSGGEARLATALDREMRRLFGRSLKLRQVAAGDCSGCAAELVAMSKVVFDLSRFGILMPSPKARVLNCPKKPTRDCAPVTLLSPVQESVLEYAQSGKGKN